jgi:hypothetical protein
MDLLDVDRFPIAEGFRVCQSFLGAIGWLSRD